VTTLRLLDGTRADGRRVDIVIAGGVITEVVEAGTAEAGTAAAGTPSDESVEAVDLGGALVLPAFVEPHAHLDKALAADLAPNPTGDLIGAIDAWTAYGPRLTIDDMADRAERCARMLVANGVTAIRTHADVHEAVGLRAVEALVRVREGLRDTVAIEVTALPKWPTTGAEGADQRARLREAVAIGVDHIGGCPHLELDARGSLDVFLELAAEHDRGLDLHVDETLDPAILTLELLADRVTASGFSGPVLAGHCVSLGMQEPAVQQRVAEKVAAAGISITVLPQTNLYLQARGLPTAPPRGLTAIAALRRAGVNVAAGADNVQDPFNVVGRGDPLETAALLVMAGHLTPDDALTMVTAAGRTALHLPPVAIAAENPAELVVVAAAGPREAVASAPSTRLVVHDGRVVSRRAVVDGWPPGAPKRAVHGTATTPDLSRA
jgi:cytosine deaminase